MTNQIIKVHNIETGEVIEREMNAEELAQWESDQAKLQAQREVEALKVAEKQAILDRLGLTADEAALLLGAN